MNQSIWLGTLHINAKIYHTKTSSKNQFLEDCSKVTGVVPRSIFGQQAIFRTWCEALSEVKLLNTAPLGNQLWIT